MDRQEKLEQLEKILQSRTLQSSESLKAFLRFVVSEALDGQGSHPKEYTIATQVFGRGRSYDPRTDSVVRVQAGRLRSKLREYYATEGKNDPLVIDLPKGQYVPVFLPAADRQAAAVGEVPADAPRSRLGFVAAALGVLCVGLALAAWNYRAEARRLAEPPSAPKPAENAALRLWADFLRDPEPILVAYSNTLFKGRAETGMQLLNPLDSPGFRAASVDKSVSVITDHYTGVGELMGVYYLGNLFSQAGHAFHVKRSLLLMWDDMKTQNLVILGSNAENLLLRELPQKQDFVFRLIKNRFGIENLHPGAGEEKFYFAREEGPSMSEMSEDYAVVSLIQGLGDTNRLMLLAGITTFSTQAAVEYVTTPEHVRDLMSRLGAPLPPFYQVLLKVRVNGGVRVQISYVTHHVLK